MELVTCLLLALGGAPAGSPVQDKKPIQELVAEVAFGEPPARDVAIAEIVARQNAREAILEILKTTEETEVMGAAVLVLGRTGKRARSDLEEFLSPDVLGGTQTKVLSGLVIVGAEGSWLAPEVLELVKVGVDGLAKRAKSGGTHPLADMRTNQALMAMCVIGAEPKPALKQIERLLALELARDDFSQICRLSAACALWKVGGEKDRALALLGEGLAYAAEGPVVEKAVFGLGEMGENAREIRTRLEERLAGASAQLKVTLHEALDKIDGKKPLQLLGPDGR
jgi:hypothetical protein